MPQVKNRMKADGRKLDRKTQEAIRLTAVERVREGENPRDVIASYGMNRTTIHKWLSRVQDEATGLRKLIASTASGRPRKLSEKQAQQLLRWLDGKNPMQYGYDACLWSRSLISRLVFDKYAVSLSRATVGALLARLDLRMPKPFQRAAERNQQAFEQWRRENYSAIVRHASAEHADIYFWDTLDEDGSRQAQHLRTAFVVNPKGEFWYATYNGALSTELFIDLLEKLMDKRKRRLHLLVLGSPGFQQDLIEKYMAPFKGRLHLYFLPV